MFQCNRTNVLKENGYLKRFCYISDLLINGHSHSKNWHAVDLVLFGHYNLIVSRFTQARYVVVCYILICSFARKLIVLEV